MAVGYCSKCGTALDVDDHYCPGCGQATQPTTISADDAHRIALADDHVREMRSGSNSIGFVVALVVIVISSVILNQIAPRLNWPIGAAICIVIGVIAGALVSGRLMTKATAQPLRRR